MATKEGLPDGGDKTTVVEVDDTSANDAGVAQASEAEDEGSEQSDEDGEGLAVSFGGNDEEEADEATAPNWAKNLRAQHKELTKRNRELEDEIKNLRPREQVVELGQKPTLESCDYDGEKFEAELTAWHDRKRKADAKQAEAAANVEKERQAWQSVLQGYEAKKEALKAKDYVQSEDFVKDVLSVTQQAIILTGANDSALFVYALGKNRAKAQELAKITDPIKFAFEVARLEKDLKVTKKNAPAPEKAIRTGSGSLSASTNSTLERLRAEAEKTGNYSKVVAYKKQLRAKSG